jgi:hypothetical protein
MDRRAFLSTMNVVFARQLVWAADIHKIEKVGLHLFTIRSVMR